MSSFSSHVFYQTSILLFRFNDKYFLHYHFSLFSAITFFSRFVITSFCLFVITPFCLFESLLFAFSESLLSIFSQLLLSVLSQSLLSIFWLSLLFARTNTALFNHNPMRMHLTQPATIMHSGKVLRLHNTGRRRCVTAIGSAEEAKPTWYVKLEAGDPTRRWGASRKGEEEVQLGTVERAPRDGRPVGNTLGFFAKNLRLMGVFFLFVNIWPSPVR